MNKTLDRVDVFAAVWENLGRPDGDNSGEYWTECPSCGRSRSGENKNFSFSERGYKCFRCDIRGTLVGLAHRLDISDFGDIDFTPAEPKQPDPPSWLQVGERKLMKHLRKWPNLDELWAQYKVLKPETIEFFQLGYGRLPLYRRGTTEVFWDPQYRLTIPQFGHDGKLIGLYGRIPEKNTDLPRKWQPCNGSRNSVIFGMERIRGNGRVLVIVENRIDSLLMWQDPACRDLDVIALGTARQLRQDEIDTIAARKPGAVVIALDNDMVGTAVGEILKQQQDEWIAANQKDGKSLNPPPQWGKRIEHQLQRRIPRVEMIKWPEGAPCRADVGWLYENGIDF